MKIDICKNKNITVEILQIMLFALFVLSFHISVPLTGYNRCLLDGRVEISNFLSQKPLESLHLCLASDFGIVTLQVSVTDVPLTGSTLFGMHSLNFQFGGLKVQNWKKISSIVPHLVL